ALWSGGAALGGGSGFRPAARGGPTSAPANAAVESKRVGAMGPSLSFGRCAAFASLHYFLFFLCPPESPRGAKQHRAPLGLFLCGAGRLAPRSASSRGRHRPGVHGGVEPPHSKDSLTLRGCRSSAPAAGAPPLRTRRGGGACRRGPPASTAPAPRTASSPAPRAGRR